MFHFMNYAIFRELCDRMRFEVDCAKSHHQVISEGLLLEMNFISGVGGDNLQISSTIFS